MCEKSVYRNQYVVWEKRIPLPDANYYRINRNANTIKNIHKHK